AGSEIGELLDRFQLKASVLALDGRRIVIDRLGEIVKLRPRLCQSRTERRRFEPALPLYFGLDFDEPFSLDLQIALQADVHVCTDLLGGGNRLRSANELVGFVSGSELRSHNAQAIVRVPIALECAPSVVVWL